jgi:hypothetical protein
MRCKAMEQEHYQKMESSVSWMHISTQQSEVGEQRVQVPGMHDSRR